MTERKNLVQVMLGDVYSRIVSGPASCYTTARKVCKARPEGYQFMPKFRKGYWDGYISLVKGKGKIPTGLLPLVAEAWKEDGLDPVYCWANVKLIENILAEDWVNIANGATQLLNGIVLRDYQVDALVSLIDSGRGIINMATGSGKTIIIAGLIKLYEFPPTLVVVNSKDLLYQTHDVLSSLLGRHIGRLGDGMRDVTKITVATIQTLHSLSKRWDLSNIFVDNRVLIVDECHHIGDNKVFDVLMDIPGWHRFGASGTPLQRDAIDDLKLMACTGSVQVEVGIQDMVKDGWAAKPVIHFYEVPEMTGVDPWDWDYQSAYVKCIVENADRNSMIVEIANEELLAKRSVLIIVTRLGHGKLLYEMMSGFNHIEYVNGSSTIEKRQEALRMLDTSLVPCVVIATPIFDEGVDIPGLDSIIFAGGGASSVKTIQRIGRGLRPKKDRNVVHIHDFIDPSNSYTLNHSEARLDTYEREGFQVQVDSSVS